MSDFESGPIVFKRASSKIPAFLSVLLFLLVIAFAFFQLDWRVMQAMLAGLKWGWVVLAFFVYILNYVLRTFRLRILLPLEGVSFYQLLSLTGLYGMYNYLLPVGTGELTLVALLKHHLKVPVVDGTASLIVVRYFDFTTIALLLPVVLVTHWHTLPSWMVYVSIFFCAIVILVGLYLFNIFLRDSALPQSVFRRQDSWIVKLEQAFVGLRNGLVRIYRKQEHFRLLLLTLAVWICVYTNYYLIVLSLGFQVTYFQIVVVSIIMIPLTMLPVQGLANFGTHEMGWVIAFSAFNQSKEVGLNIAFSSHILLLFFVLLFGACSYSIIFLARSGSVLKEQINR